MVIEPSVPIPDQTDGGGDTRSGSRAGRNLVAGPTAPDAGSNPVDDSNPVGVTGVFNGNVATAGSYDPLNHNAHRQVDDIPAVAGSIGKYPLKMTRYYNSRGKLGPLGPGWRHEYLWSAVGSAVAYPNGNVWGSGCFEPLGSSDRWEGSIFRLADGGKVIFTNGAVSSVVDPCGRTTTVAYGTNSMTVTEPGGRYLYFIFGTTEPQFGTPLLTRVELHGLGTSTVSAWVNYAYTTVSSGGTVSLKCLTDVTYSDGTSAHYTYRSDNVTVAEIKAVPLLEVCDDVRYGGPMRQIKYEYREGGEHGEIYKEKNYTTGAAVSMIAPDLKSTTDANLFTETRGDGPTRTFTYTPKPHTQGEPDPCPQYINTYDTGQQFLLSFTDFQRYPTDIGYDTNWYINSVTDARGKETKYERGPAPPLGIGEIKKITHPDGTYIQYTYTTGDPHYVATITDERGNQTIHTRDGNHRITKTEYKDSNNVLLASQEFVYNSFGQVTRHHLKNGAYVHYQYDSRGLLTAKWEPTSNPVADSNEPKTTYTYYNSGGGWTDRVLKETRPANASGYQASETYEYDRDTAGNVVGGRGLITKITHADGMYRSASWSQYGNKIWEENELRHRTSYTYDDYNRVLTMNREMGANPDEITTYTYKPTNGTGTSSYLHTTSNPDTVKTPTGITTANDYEENFRKISTTEASGTSLAAITRFGYDEVGNLTSVTDPLNHLTATVYDSRNRQTSVTRAAGTTLANTTSFAYDGASNVTRITRPDLSPEFKFYDGLNRVYLHMVPRVGPPEAPTEYTNTQFIYNPSGTINTVIDPLNHETTFEYDESDRRTLVTYNDGSSQSWNWDNAGNLAGRTTVGGQTQSFTYDNRNRKKTMVWSNSAEWQYFVYDAASRITTAQNGTGAWNTNLISTITRTYDLAGRLTLDRQALGGASSKDVAYYYDLDGKVTRMTVVANAYDYTYSYDARGRLEKITDTLTGALKFQYYYDAASNETKRHNWINGVAQQYTYNVLDQISARDLLKGTSNLASETYVHHARGPVTLIDRTGTNDDRFGYYLNDELNWASYDATALTDVTYNLDRAGNRTSIVAGGVNKPYTADSINQYTAAENIAVSNGPAEHQITLYNGITFSYINDGRLASVSNGNTGITFSYDAFGRCVKRLIDGWSAKYSYYDGEKELLECGVGGGASYRNVYGKGIDEILMRTDNTLGPVTFYYQQDHNGNVTHITDAGGLIKERYQYDAFGGHVIYNAAGTKIDVSGYANPWRFTGRRYQPTFGIYEYRARAYHPRLGRFTSEDPKLFVRGINLGKAPDDWSFETHPEEAEFNLFRYCGNDPLDFVDPTGEFLDTLADIGFIAYDVYKLATDSGSRADNWRALGFDIAGAAIPFATGAGAAYRSAKAVERATETAKAATRTKTDRILQHLSRDDITKAAWEIRSGNLKGGHVQEVKTNFGALEKRIEQIKNGLSKPDLTPQNRQALEAELKKASGTYDAAKRIFEYPVPDAR